jgi:hypothetical protein
MQNKLQKFFTGLFTEIESEKTDKEIATEVKEIKMNAELATEDLIDDESELGVDAEDVDDNQGEIFTQDELTKAEDDYEITHGEIMKMCEEKVNSCNEQGLKDLFAGTKKFYDNSSCEEAKKAIALKMNNRVFELIQ